MKFSTLAILIGSGMILAFGQRVIITDCRFVNESTNGMHGTFPDAFLVKTNQPSPPKLAISMGRIERDVCATNTTYYWPDGPQGETKWTYIDASRELILRVNGLQTNVTVPVLHIQWLMRLNKATGEWSYFVGSGETNVYAPPSGFVMQFPEVKKQSGLKNVPPPPTPK